jgi:N-acetylmuramoyl-L-alanine amidase
LLIADRAFDGTMYKNIKESDINLKFSMKLKENLEALGAVVYLTRDGDYDLSSTTINRKRSDLFNRIRLINKSDADIYISIHINAETSNLWYGAQAFYYPINKKNIVLAKSIQKSLTSFTKTKREASRINDTLMYTNVKTPGALVELGFITNSNDRYKLMNDKYQNSLVDAICSGVIEYFNL